MRLTKRKNPPPGVARSYRVRLEPDQAQRAEFKRLFAALRYAKNWCNGFLKNLPLEQQRAPSSHTTHFMP